ncbi:ladderlectin-like isoform X2 [Cheilinus undulatus]|nr:ladderlectin-like isoform X2 [Cheilinus undulatus]XP_041636062.1 ladderlectin-like isoform X2 [Cheilinus undulatus]
MLTMFVLVCAVMALTNAAAVPQAVDDRVTGNPFIQEGVQEAQPDVLMFGPYAQQNASLSVQGSGFCPLGWAGHNGRCFIYIPSPTTWAYAEKRCQARGGNLASVHSFDEYIFIQEMILEVSRGYPLAWLGGSDAQQEYVWLWSDGSYFNFPLWCPGQPDNKSGWQNCIQMNYGDHKCWDDQWCTDYLPFVCAKTM